jgi:hypothetical protein
MLNLRVCFVGMFALLLLTNTCSAGFSLLVNPVDTKFVNPGESISYRATVSDDELDESLPEDVKFSVHDTDKRAGWTYTFDYPELTLNSPGESKSSVLTMTVPAEESPGVYYYTVETSVWNTIDYEIGEAGITQVYVVNTDVTSVPEFPTVAVPMLAILGIVTIFGRRKSGL